MGRVDGKRIGPSRATHVRLDSKWGQGSRAFPGGRPRYTLTVSESLPSLVVHSFKTKNACPLRQGLTSRIFQDFQNPSLFSTISLFFPHV